MTGRPLAILICSALLAAPASGDEKDGAKAWPAGIQPKSPDGTVLNLDFETGDLRDWVATGRAFDNQPIKGDTVARRRGDMRSGHRGTFWIGGYEIKGDKPQGTLSSATIRVTHPWASFLVAGGHHDTTCVQVVRRDTGKTIFQASGRDDEQLRPVVVDLREHEGKEIFIRLVDRHSGGWGHVNFDEFRFHAEKPAFPDLDQAPVRTLHAGLSPEKAAEAMTVPEGFNVTLFAGEPDVKQPIAMAIDDRGRVWVAEAYAYPRKQPDGKGEDRILIFEDADGDGRFDKRTVFCEGLNLVSGLEVGFGGAWVGQAPHLLFIPDQDGDDKPDGEPQVLLDGWHYEDTHETLNAFIWGPDGWLYGCHGVFTHSRVGRPGTPDEERIPLNAGIWRYHPTKHVFEVFAHGTSNPWGVDFNDHGQAFATACVIPHLYHVIQGARYHRQAGQHFNPYTYDDIRTIADHLHYEGNIREHAHWGRTGEPPPSTLQAGGGHAHSGAMIYLGGAWPEEYRGRIFMNNIHGARLNVDVLVPEGSGYVGRHGPDFLLANDAASQILNFRYGPDGQVYLIDWYDTNQCHHGDPTKHDRTNGRIFKITFENTKHAQDRASGTRERPDPTAGSRRPLAKHDNRLDLKKLSSAELVRLQLEENDWYVRHARRILQERGPDPKTHAALATIAFEHPDETRRLRGLWALHVTGGLTPERIETALRDESAYVRGWAIQLTLEDGLQLKARGPRPAESEPSGRFLKTLTAMARNDPSPIVRLYLASGLQRMPLENRWDVLTGLASHAEDAGDHNLPLMYWYAIEPLAAEDMQRAYGLAAESRIPVVRSYTLRRIAETGSPEAVAFLVEELGKAKSAGEQTTLLSSINQALKGRRTFPMPQSWSKVYETLSRSSDATVREESRALAVKFGDERALTETRSILEDATAEAARRKSALESLLSARDAKLPPVLQRLVSDKDLEREALRGLAAYSDPVTPRVVLKVYADLGPDAKRDALGTLASRPAYARELLAAVGRKEIAPAELSADLVRQLRNLEDESLDRQINEVWGVVRDTAADKKKLIAEYEKLITGGGPAPDVHLGRAVYAKTCQQCHKLFGTGGEVGPDLTGSNRADLEYLLSNVIDPSAVMARDYQPAVIVTDAGRTVTGIVKNETPDAITVATANESVTLPRGEIEIMKRSDKSMMPDDLWQQLKPREVRSLVAYLAGTGQVPMQATPENAKTLSGGRDLAGWTGDPALWKVEGGEIVGTSPGLSRNEFLVSDLLVGDFELTLEVKLTPDSGNSGIQFRSERLPGGEMRGYRADVGKGWWGKLYEEHGRGLLSKEPGEKSVKPGKWNSYRIRAVGSRVQTWLNGHRCVDLDDPQGARRGVIGLQLHSGDPMEVRFRNLRLTLISASK